MTFLFLLRRVVVLEKAKALHSLIVILRFYLFKICNLPFLFVCDKYSRFLTLSFKADYTRAQLQGC